MTTYSRNDLERLAGEGDSSATYRNSNSSATFHYPTLMRPTLQSRIYDAVVKGGTMTRRQIADALGVKKAPWVNAAIEQLVSDGYLVKYEAQSDKRSFMWLYEVAP